MKYVLLFFCVFFVKAPAFVLAAPCCSGSALVPALITTDSQGQVALRGSQSTIVGNSQSDGASVFRRSGNSENTTTMQLSGAYAVTPLLQIHMDVIGSRRFRGLDANQASHFGMGDLSAGVAYEVLQQFHYSLWQPRIWAFVDGTAPTGQSVYDSPDSLMTRVHGRGAWAVTAGIFALKTWRSWDAFCLAEHRRYWGRTVSFNGISSQLVLGPTTAFDIGAGYNLEDFRLGASLGPTWDGALRSSNGDFITNAEPRLVWNVSIQFGYTLKEIWALTLVYNDQTLFGPTYNAELARSAGVTVTRRFE